MSCLNSGDRSQTHSPHLWKRQRLVAHFFFQIFVSQELLTIAQGTDDYIFDGNPDHCLDPRILKNFFIIAPMNNIGGIGPWRRSVLSQCFCCCSCIDSEYSVLLECIWAIYIIHPVFF